MEIVDTLKNGYKIIQDSDRFKFGIDAVMLSHFAFEKIRNSENVIDLGTGNGIIPLLLTKSRAKSLTGLEIQAENVDLAQRSVALNNLSDKIQIIHGDIKSVSVEAEINNYSHTLSDEAETIKVFLLKSLSLSVPLAENIVLNK